MVGTTIGNHGVAWPVAVATFLSQGDQRNPIEDIGEGCACRLAVLCDEVVARALKQAYGVRQVGVVNADVCISVKDDKIRKMGIQLP